MIHLIAIGGNGGCAGKADSGCRGGKGGNAGNGGHVRITTNERDTHLVMLVKYDVEGGICGKSEERGSGGVNGKDGHFEWGVVTEYGECLSGKK